MEQEYKFELTQGVNKYALIKEVNKLFIHLWNVTNSIAGQ